MSTLQERLKEVMRELNLSSRKELADFCGVSEGLVSQWFSGDTELGPKPLLAFSKTKFSLEWLVSGRLPKHVAPELEELQELQREIQLARNTSLVDPEQIKKMITVFCNADDDQRETIMQTVSAMEELQKSLASPNKPKKRRLTRGGS